MVAAIVPWNSPLLLLCWKLAPALAAGCTMVAKPSDYSPASAVELAALMDEAGFPPGTFNVVTGFGPAVGKALAAHPGIDKVAFTGSTGVGAEVAKAAAANITGVLLELGGKSAHLVFDDADLDAACNGVLAGVFAATGQTCMAGSRLLVSAGVHDALVDKIAERARAIRLGDPRAAETEMGPVATEPQYRKVLSFLEAAATEGATVAAGGRADDALGGFFVQPTVLTDVKPTMTVACEEVFGPVLAVIPFDTEEEAVALANDSRYGLAGAVWTKDIHRGHRVAHAHAHRHRVDQRLPRRRPRRTLRRLRPVRAWPRERHRRRARVHPDQGRLGRAHRRHPRPLPALAPRANRRRKRAGMDELNEDERAMVGLVRDFVNREVRPVVRELEHANTYPDKLIEQMKQLGIFGLAIPEPWGDTQVSTSCYALITEELARGWMSLAGAMGGHTVVAKLLLAFGTEAQKRAYLPRMATGELRATMALTEPGGGSDLQAIRTIARRVRGDGPGGTGGGSPPCVDGVGGASYVVNGSKTWITNARRSGLVALLVKTDPKARPAHAGISIILAEPGPGFTVSRDLPKLGYKGVESCELAFDDYRVPGTALLGEREGEGFAQMMRGLEIGRIQVASRALGVGQAALDDALRYAQQREAFGKPIWKHQSIGNYLADMATKLTAARQLVLYAARCYDSGRRADMEAGMAKLFASETAMEVALDAVRIHGGYGYSTEFDVERYFRDAPLMIVGEGTNEIQRNVIARQLIQRHPATS